MVIALSLVFGLVVSVADIFLILKTKKLKEVIYTVIRDTILVDLFFYGVMKYIFKEENIFFPAYHEGKYTFYAWTFRILSSRNFPISLRKKAFAEQCGYAYGIGATPWCNAFRST